MKLSNYLIKTTKEAPAEAELISHQLMLRAGMIRQTASGIYSWLPLGLRILQKVEQIVREEMNRAGALEILMPMTQPANLWQQSGRWQDYGPELLRFKDRHQRDFCLGPTHEEVVSDIVRNEIHSYRQLPLNLYQIQTKFRDEIRPRFGLMRGREFVMKDAYSFHIEEPCLQQTYQIMYDAYQAIFDRLQLEVRAVSADSGSIGGDKSHEFHVLADSGEDALAFSDQSDYCANVELAPSICNQQRAQPKQSMTIVDTPTQRTIKAVSDYLNLPSHQCIKLLLVEGEEHPAVALILRGDHELNEIKATKHPLVKSPLTLVEATTAEKVMRCEFGFLGPVNVDVPLLVDTHANALNDFCCGANQHGKHYINVNWGVDLPEPEVADLRTVQAGDPSPDGKGTLKIRRGIEVGHIFQLGKKYSDAMDVAVQNENSVNETLWMGCYGVGVSRIVAAAIEQNHDDKGIIWPQAMAPWQVVIIPINAHRSPEVEQMAQQIYQFCIEQGIEVCMDDRSERPGKKFADFELIGCPQRLIISDKTLANQSIEYYNRKRDQQQIIDLSNWQQKLTQLFATAL